MSLPRHSVERDERDATHSARCYSFDRFHLDAENHALSKDGAPVALTRKTIELLIVLVEHGGRVLSKAELLKMLWAEVAVEEANLSQNVYLLRKALGENADQPRFIKTIPKRGYSFVAEATACGVVETDVPERLSAADGDATRSERAATSGARGLLSRRPLSVVAVAALIVATLAFALLLSRGGREPRTPPEVRSLAVLPFKILGAGAGDDSPLALGLTDTLITRLGNSRQLRVLPTSAVFKYAGGDFDPVEVARRLGVDAVMTGTVQRDGGRVRVTVQLFDAHSGRLLWAEPFEAEGGNVFKIQDTTAERVARGLNIKLGATGKEVLSRRHTGNPGAYEAYLRGVYFWNKRTRESLNLSVRYFQEATEKDPEYARAHAGLADALGVTARHGHAVSGRDEVFERAKAAALRALELDEGSAEAHTALGMIYKNYELDSARAEREYRRALELDPNYSTAHSRYGLLLLHRGDLDGALERMRSAYELDPLSRVSNTNMGAIHFHRREYDEAAVYYRRSIEIEPADYMAVGSLAEVYEMQGRLDEAVAKFAEAVAASEGKPGHYQLLGDLGFAFAKAGRRAAALDVLRKLRGLPDEGEAEWPEIKIHVGMGESDRALELLERGASRRSPWVYNIPVILDLRFGARYDPLRATPRFAALVDSCFNSPYCK